MFPSIDLDQVLISGREGKEAPHCLMNTSSVLQVTGTVYNVYNPDSPTKTHTQTVREDATREVRIAER